MSPASGGGAQPAVTVLTLAGGTEEGLRGTADALAAQTLVDWEWLAAGPTAPGARDRSPRALAGDPRAAVEQAAGRYTVLLESGERLGPTALEKWLWFLESHPECAFVDAYRVGADGRSDPRTVQAPRNGLGAGMVRTAVLGETSGAATRAELWLRCASLGHGGGTVIEPLVEQRDHGVPPAVLNGSTPLNPFPHVEPRHHSANAWVPFELPSAPPLAKNGPRLLLVAPFMTIGGADKFNLDLLDQLTDRGWEVTVATTLSGDHGWQPHFARRTPDVFPLAHFLHPVDHPRFLHHLVRSRGIDVVLVANSELGYRLLPYLRSVAPEVTLMDFCHSEIERWNNGGYPRFSVQYGELLDLTVTASHHLKGYMVERGAEEERIAVCHIGVDVDELHPDTSARVRVRARLGLAEDVPVILFAGRVSEDKQPRVLAETLLRLRREQHRFHAVVAGDGPDLAWLHGFVNGHSLGEVVHLLGAVPPSEIGGLMNAADIVFLPSLWEGVAASLYEAMACGLPVVAAAVGGQAELVTPDCGVLVERSDERGEALAYARALAGLLREPERRAAMGEAARARVETGFRLDDMGERMAALLARGEELHQRAPRPVPGVGLGRAIATEAVDLTRLQLPFESWLEAQAAALGSGVRVAWQVRTFVAVQRVAGPLYRWTLEQPGMTWVRPAKERMKQALLAPAARR